MANELPRAPGSYTSPIREFGQEGDLLANLELLVFYVLLFGDDLEITYVQ
jgi:hypothetical protein